MRGFEAIVVPVEHGQVFMRRTGDGPAVMLLHGFPETHQMWHRLGPALSATHTVLCADLPGYGASHIDDDVALLSKRTMAAMLVDAASRLGVDEFAVVGHDRGGRVAYRMALDHPRRVTRLAVLDVVPTGEALQRADDRFALGYWPWSLLAQPAPLPEHLLQAAPEAFVDHALSTWGSSSAGVPTEIRAHYVDALRNTAHGVCAEYRAAATIDRDHDDADRADGRMITCPTLVLWAEHGPLDEWYTSDGGPLGIWTRWATDVSGHPIAGGHFFPEQNPDATLAALQQFLRDV